MLFKEYLSIFPLTFFPAILTISKLSESSCTCPDQEPLNNLYCASPLAIIKTEVCTRLLPDINTIFAELGTDHISLYVLFTSLNYLTFSLGFGFITLLVSITDKKKKKKKSASAHFIPKTNLAKVFSVLSESSVNVLNNRPVACLQLGKLLVKHKPNYYKLSNWSQFVSCILV